MIDDEHREQAWAVIETEAESIIEEMSKSYQYLISISDTDKYDFTVSMEELIKDKLEM